MKKKLILLLLITFALPISAKAASMEIKCSSSSVTVGDTVRCTVTAKAKEIGGAKGTVKITNGSYVSSEKKTCAIGDLYYEENDHSRTLDCADILQNNSAEIAVYTIKTTKVGTMTFQLTNAIVIDGNFQDVSVGNPKATVTVNDKTTTTTTTKKQVIPYNPGNNNNNSQQQEPQQNNNNNSNNSNNNQNQEPATQGIVDPGEPTTEAPVDDTTTTQRVTPKTDSNTVLSSLTIDGIPFDFKSDTLEYNLETKIDLNKLVFHYKTVNANALVTANTTELKDGMNNVEITVSYEGETTVYKLNINKVKAKSDTVKIAKIVGSASGIAGLSYLLYMLIKRF